MAAAQTARVIDLESFRARRLERAPAPAPQVPLIWVPVVVWMPLWRMVG